MKNFRYRFLSCKVETWCTHRPCAVVSCISESGPWAYNSWSHIPLKGLRISINEGICRIFLKNCNGNKVETWCTHRPCTVVSCISESGPWAYNSWSYIPWKVLRISINERICRTFLKNWSVTKLKPGTDCTYMESGLMCRVYTRIRARGP